jgi:hypothetical protein
MITNFYGIKERLEDSGVTPEVVAFVMTGRELHGDPAEGTFMNWFGYEAHLDWLATAPLHEISAWATDKMVHADQEWYRNQTVY